MIDKEQLLASIIEEAKAVGIPVSSQIQPEVIVNSRAKNRFGCCKKVKNGYIIEISQALFAGEEGPLRQTLAHEMLHTCKGCQNHGVKWKEYAAAMQAAYGYLIKRTSSHEELGLPKPDKQEGQAPARYVLRCSACGREFRRSKASKLVKYPHLFRCKCGGKLKRM